MIASICSLESTYEPDAEMVRLIRQTQVTLVVELSKPTRVLKFRGTVVEKQGRNLTILTAGHAIADLTAELSRVTAMTERGDFSVELRSWSLNPAYSPRSRSDIPGADHALLRVRAEDRAEAQKVVDRLEVAEITPERIPDGRGEVVAIWVVDQFRELHRLRAGNFSNPLWLEWGPVYKPVPGDSGSGIFAAIPREDRTLRPVLIGVVTDRASRGGGGGSLVTRRVWRENSEIQMQSRP
jgi:hypothetical protein